jgi:hypothetical protein
MNPLSRRPSETTKGSKVLLCSLGSHFCELLEADKTVYCRHYRSVDEIFPSSIEELLRAIGKGYEIVHLFCDLSRDGALVDRNNATLVGSELIAKCCGESVKLLWIANENTADDYIKGFRAAGRPLNLIMTINRNGKKFSGFLEELLSKISAGETLPAAWSVLVPQAEGRWQQDLPGCIFYAGRANVKLLS